MKIGPPVHSRFYNIWDCVLDSCLKLNSEKIRSDIRVKIVKDSYFFQPMPWTNPLEVKWQGIAFFLIEERVFLRKWMRGSWVQHVRNCLWCSSQCSQKDSDGNLFPFEFFLQNYQKVVGHDLLYVEILELELGIIFSCYSCQSLTRLPGTLWEKLKTNISNIRCLNWSGSVASAAKRKHFP